MEREEATGPAFGDMRQDDGAARQVRQDMWMAFERWSHAKAGALQSAMIKLGTRLNGQIDLARLGELLHVIEGPDVFLVKYGDETLAKVQITVE